MKKLFLITGGAGFIGSNLAKRLVDNDNDIIIIDDLSSGFKKNIPPSKNITFINKKIQDLNFNDVPLPNGIFHLAAQASVPLSIDSFNESSQNNMVSTIVIFDWAKSNDIPLVYASSSAVYGNLPIGSDLIEKYEILSPYAQDKLSMEHYAQMMFNVYDMSSIGLRFFNAYGPNQDPKNPYSGVISIFIDQIKEKKTVTINGGYQTRDFIYVDDICNVCITSMKKIIEEEKTFDILNVGTGNSITIDELFMIINNLIGGDVNIIRKCLPKGDPEKSSGTYDKLQKTLGISIDDFIDIEKGLNKTINFFLAK